jgi:hypothetical protein
MDRRPQAFLEKGREGPHLAEGRLPVSIGPLEFRAARQG